MSLQGTERQPIVISSMEDFTSKTSAPKMASVEPSTVPKAKKNYKKHKGPDRRQGRPANDASPSDPHNSPRVGEPNAAMPPSKKRKVHKPATQQPALPSPNSHLATSASSSKANPLNATQPRQPQQQGQHNNHGRQQKYSKKRKHTPESECAREVLVFPEEQTYSTLLNVVPPFIPPPPTLIIPTTSSPRSFISLPTPEADVSPPPLPLSSVSKSNKRIKRKPTQNKQGNKPARYTDIKSQPGVYSSVFPTDHIRTVIFEHVPPDIIREGPLHIRNWLFPTLPVTAMDIDEGNQKVLLEFAHVMYAMQVVKCARVHGHPYIKMHIRRPEMGRTDSYITGPRMEQYAISAHPYALPTHNLLPPPYQLHPPPVPLHASPMPPPDHLHHSDPHYLGIAMEHRSRTLPQGEPFQETVKMLRETGLSSRHPPHPFATRVFDDPIAPPHPLFRSNSEPALRRRSPSDPSIPFHVSANAVAIREQLERQKFNLEKEIAAKRQRLADLRAPEIDLTPQRHSPVNRSPLRSPVLNRAPTPTAVSTAEIHVITEISPVSTGTVTSRASARSASGCSTISESTTVSTSTTVTNVSASTNMSVATSVSAVTSLSSHSTSATSTSSATTSLTSSDINTRRMAVEAGVAHSKLLMSKFAAATTKVERDALMVELREQTKQMAVQPSLVVKPAPFVGPRGGWPTTKPEGVIIWLSDDEEEVYDDDGEIVKDHRSGEAAAFDNNHGFDIGEGGFDDYDENFDITRTYTH